MKESVTCGCFPTGKHYPGIAHLMRIAARGTAVDIDPDAPWADLPIAVLDTETTGIDASGGDRIVELGIVVGVRGEIVERFNWLIHPEREIPEGARAVHGISDDDVKDAPKFREIAAAICDAMRGKVPAAYNAPFDKGFVTNEIARAAVEGDALPACLRADCVWVDPLVWARELQKYEKGKKLTEVATRLGIKLENAHRASDDAEAALRVMYAFAGDARVPQTYAALIQEQRRLARAQEDDFRAWRQRNPRT